MSETNDTDCCFSGCHKCEGDNVMKPSKSELKASFESYVEQVSRPGKFSGCEPWAPYFWQSVLDGCAETVSVYGEEIAKLTVEQCDSDLFPALTVGDRVYLRECADGYVMQLESDLVEAELAEQAHAAEQERGELF